MKDGPRAGIGSLRFGVHVPNLAGPQTLVDIGIKAERHGWDGCFLWDHVAGIPGTEVPVADPWVVLGALAVRTRRIRLGTAVTALARRRPHKLARETVTLDHLSGGRVVLGVGLGNPARTEHAAFGEPAEPRVLAAKLDEALAVLAGLWSGEPFTHAGRYYQVHQALFRPPPVQRPRIPVWVACSWPHRRPLARAVRWDGVVAARHTVAGDLEPMTPADVAALVAEVRGLRPSREPLEVAVVNVGLPDSVARAEEYAAAGATWWLATGWVPDLAGLVERAPVESLTA